MVNIQDLSIAQLQRAAAIKEQIAKLELELGTIGTGKISAKVAVVKPTSKGKRIISTAGKARIAAAAKARWAKIRGEKSAAVTEAKPAKKRTLSPAVKAKIAAAAKARWAKVKAEKAAA